MSLKNQQHIISETTKLINIDYTFDNTFYDNDEEDFYTRIIDFWKIIYSKIKNLNNLKRYITVFFFVYFMFSFHIISIKYKDEVFIIDNKRTYLKKDYINKYNSYIDNCTEGILLDRNNLKLPKKPKISVTMPIYNGAKYLYYSLRSIQNQKLKDIEIILIDDFSQDNSISIIENFMKEDPRIKLIRNKTNRKILYSKSIAALNTKGKYIFQFDQDDILIRDDVFDLIFYEAENNNLDLVQFRDIIKTTLHFNKRERVNIKFKHMLPYKETHIKTQPELKETLFTQNNNYILWGLLIKSDLYKKAVYIMWPIIINYKLTFFEDHTITVLTIIYAKRYKYLNNFCLIHLSHKKSVTNDFPNNKEFYLSFLFFINNLFDYYLKYNPEDIKIVINLLISVEFFSIKAYKTYPPLFFYVFRKIFSSNYLNYEDLIFLVKELKMNDKYTLFLTYEHIMNSTQFFSIMNYQYNTEVNKTNSSIININNKFKFSIIIYLTEFNFLEETISTIEHQNFTNFEIITIYDNKEKDELKKIQNYIRIFPNIKLINNEAQFGLYYSYSMAILESKGDYILLLQPGYTLSNNDVLNILYENIIKNKSDVLEFNLLINYNGKNNNGDALSLYKCSHINTEIQLNFFKYNLNYKNADEEKEILTNKIIKSSLLKNIIRKYRFNKRKNKLYNYFDEIILFLLNKEGANFTHINDYGMIGYINRIQKLSLYNIINNQKQKNKDSIFYINFIFDNSKNDENEKKIVLYELYNIMGFIYNKFTIKDTESISLYNKFQKSIYISKEDKDELTFYYNSLNN